MLSPPPDTEVPSAGPHLANLSSPHLSAKLRLQGTHPFLSETKRDVRVASHNAQTYPEGGMSSVPSNPPMVSVPARPLRVSGASFDPTYPSRVPGNKVTPSLSSFADESLNEIIPPIAGGLRGNSLLDPHPDMSPPNAPVHPSTPNGRPSDALERLRTSSIVVNRRPIDLDMVDVIASLENNLLEEDLPSRTKLDSGPASASKNYAGSNAVAVSELGAPAVSINDADSNAAAAGSKIDSKSAGVQIADNPPVLPSSRQLKSDRSSLTGDHQKAASSPLGGIFLSLVGCRCS